MRTGREGGVRERREKEGVRKSKDAKINGEGRKLCNFLGELG